MQSGRSLVDEPEQEAKRARKEVAAFLKGERPCPNGLVSQQLLAGGVEGPPATLVCSLEGSYLVVTYHDKIGFIDYIHLL